MVMTASGENVIHIGHFLYAKLGLGGKTVNRQSNSH